MWIWDLCTHGCGWGVVVWEEEGLCNNYLCAAPMCALLCTVAVRGALARRACTLGRLAAAPAIDVIEAVDRLQARRVTAAIEHPRRPSTTFNDRSMPFLFDCMSGEQQGAAFLV